MKIFNHPRLRKNGFVINAALIRDIPERKLIFRMDENKISYKNTKYISYSTYSRLIIISLYWIYEIWNILTCIYNQYCNFSNY